MSSKSKRCIFKGCPNTSLSVPEKIFISVPRSQPMRNKWFYAATGDKRPAPAGGGYFCCEDHFNLESDATNWQYYKVMGANIILKETAIPSRNVEPKKKSQLTPTTKKRKHELATSLAADREGIRRKLFGDVADQATLGGIDAAVPSGVHVPLMCKPGSTGTSAEGVSPFSNILGQQAAELISVDETSAQLQLTPPAAEGSPQDRIHQVAVSSPSGKFYVAETELTCTSKIKTRFSKGVQVKPKVSSKGITAHAETADKCVVTDKWKGIKPEPRPEGGPKEVNPFQSSSSESLLSSDTQQTTSITSVSSGSQIKKKFQSETIEGVELAKLKTQSRFYLGLPSNVYFVVDLLSCETQVDYTKILIALKKIRTNDQFQRIATDFAKSTSYANKAFQEAIPQMRKLLSQLIFWPDRNKTKQLIPSQFQAFYRNVESIIDCFEIEIQKPSDPLQQALTWSSYKSCNTAKYLISCTPNGLVNFISPGFGGRATDVEIVNKSGFLDVITQNSVIMADRGFKHVAASLTKKHCQLVRPPSVKSGEKMSREEVKETKVIAALRIHVERLIRRVREFEMVKPHATVHHSMIGALDDVVTIVCALVNLQGPLIV